MNRLTCTIATLALSTALAGCPGASVFDEMEPATFQNAEDARAWAGLSAPNILFTSQFYVMAPLLEASEDVDHPSELDCPRWEEVSGGVEVTGGCTDSDGLTWHGRIDIIESAESLSVRFPGGSSTTSDFEIIRAAGFGYEGTVTCNGTDFEVFMDIDGEVAVTARGSGNWTFEVDLALRGHTVDEESCEEESGVLGVDYSGRMTLENPDAEGRAQRSTWNGSGRAGMPEVGWANVETENELIDVTVCDQTPLSGHTQAGSEGTTLEIRYLGADDCEEGGKADWYLDGERQGELMGIHCATGSGTAWPAALLLVALGITALRRRVSI